MDAFFSQSKFAVSFQPFIHLIDLERKIKDSGPSFLIVPQWYIDDFGRANGFEPIITPAFKGAVTYNKTLLISKDSGIGVKDLRNRSLAMTSMGHEGEKKINTLLFPGMNLKAETINLVIVPKDTDALFALALGQVDAALVNKESFDRINSLNQKILQPLISLIDSEDIPMPVLCYRKGAVSEEDLKILIGIFTDKENILFPKKIMEMLNIDEWRKIQN
ncbi:MAG: PhnD/SsuA/transferrin family substrate-binding protein [Proteobacteria bacterium]|nr:PhnD/SsuA/transferrin family substrate-binding protein [Pseudomonadota bacterium]